MAQPPRFNPFDLPPRFAAKIWVSPSGCWLWTGGKSRDGHGHYKDDSRRTVMAHRFAYECLVGPIPEGAILRHTCDVPNCVNPAHLEPGTHQDNVRDRVERGRSACGERNGRSKLTAERVQRIVDDLLGGRTPTVIAEEHGVDERAIRFIRDGANWKHATA